jgi:two-component sensor histidine kinase
VGIPAELDWKNAETLGLMLVEMLVEHQLRGQVELDRTCGTTFRLRFAAAKSTFKQSGKG